MSDESVLQDDLREMLQALGMSDGAQAKSPHQVFKEALGEMKRQLAAGKRSAARSDEAVHLSHCHQGEYEGSCKYGDADCPAAPTTSPEPSSSPEIPDNSAASHSKIPNNSNCSKSSNGSPEPVDVEDIAAILYEAVNPTMKWSYLYPSHNHLHASVRQRYIDAAARFQDSVAQRIERPEPDAVREIRERHSTWAKFLRMLRDRDPYHSSDIQTEIDALDRLIAALSRPAHGGWEEAMRQIMQRANESGTGEMALMDTIHAMHRLAADALARNHGEGGGPRS